MGCALSADVDPEPDDYPGDRPADSSTVAGSPAASDDENEEEPPVLFSLAPVPGAPERLTVQPTSTSEARLNDSRRSAVLPGSQFDTAIVDDDDEYDDDDDDQNDGIFDVGLARGSSLGMSPGGTPGTPGGDPRLMDFMFNEPAELHSSSIQIQGSPSMTRSVNFAADVLLQSQGNSHRDSVRCSHSGNNARRSMYGSSRGGSIGGPASHSIATTTIVRDKATGSVVEVRDARGMSTSMNNPLASSARSGHGASRSGLGGSRSQTGHGASRSGASGSGLPLGTQASKVRTFFNAHALSRLPPYTPEAVRALTGANSSSDPHGNTTAQSGATDVPDVAPDAGVTPEGPEDSEDMCFDDVMAAGGIADGGKCGAEEVAFSFDKLEARARKAERKKQGW